MANKRIPTPVPESYREAILLALYAKEKAGHPVHWRTIDRARPVG